MLGVGPVKFLGRLHHFGNNIMIELSPFVAVVPPDEPVDDPESPPQSGIIVVLHSVVSPGYVLKLPIELLANLHPPVAPLIMEP